MEERLKLGYLEEETFRRNDGKYVFLAITSGSARQVIKSSSFPVPFIKSLFLKYIESLRNVDTGERTAEYSFPEAA